MVNFPTSIDALANPTTTTLTNETGFEHHLQHANVNDIAEALEAKLGIGASTPVVNTVLRGDGAGSSVWGQIDDAYLAANAVTQRVSATLGGVSSTSTSIVQITGGGTASMTTTGRPCLVIASLLGLSNTPAAFGNVQVFMDGALLANVVYDDLLANRQTTTYVLVHTPSAAAHSWDLRWATTAASTIAAVGGYLIVTEFKR